MNSSRNIIPAHSCPPIDLTGLSDLEYKLYSNNTLFHRCLDCQAPESTTDPWGPTSQQVDACLYWLLNANYVFSKYKGICEIRNAVPYTLDYRVVATVIHLIIFVVGFFGNILVCFVVHKTRNLHTTTYCYLVSLAIADLLLISSAVPQEILAHHLYGRQWVLGQAGCSIMVFINFLSINAGALSILAFTIERYIAICHPVYAHIVCTMGRARKIIVIIWITLVLYSSPWLGLAKIKPLDRLNAPGLVYCDYRLQRSDYLAFYVADATIFYLVPLVLSLILYTKMISILRESMGFRRESDATHATAVARRRSSVGGEKLLEAAKTLRYSIVSAHQVDSMEHIGNGRWQVVRMLVVVTILFAVLWFPYRGLLVYNSLVKQPFQNKWFMLLAKTLVFCNSAINPFLYTICCHKFRRACLQLICKRKVLADIMARRKSFSPSPKTVVDPL